MTDRYAGKPMLKLLDCYVLDALGVLDDATRSSLSAMEPRFRETFGATGDWRAIVAAQMEFPETLPAKIREIWEAGHDRFVEAYGHEPDPLEFTYEFVDTNFTR